MARTSVSDPIRVDFLPLDLAGRVGLTLAPGKCDGVRWRRSLSRDLDRLRAEYGVTHLVSLVEDEELRHYRIESLYVEAERRGIGVRRLPIVDVDVPPNFECVAEVVECIGGWASAGHTVAIHCIGGIGRSGTVAGCFLVEQGAAAEAALKLLAEVRAPNCPETPAQRAFVHGYERWRRSRAGD